jgi:hypothetical protein
MWQRGPHARVVATGSIDACISCTRRDRGLRLNTPGRVEVQRHALWKRFREAQKGSNN